MRFDPDPRRLVAVLLATTALTAAGLSSLRAAAHARAMVAEASETDAILGVASLLTARLADHAGVVARGGTDPGFDGSAAATREAALSALATLHDLAGGRPRLEAALRDVDARTRRALATGATGGSALRGVHEAIEGIASFQALVVDQRAALVREAAREPFRAAGVVAGAMFFAVATVLVVFRTSRREIARLRERQGAGGDPSTLPRDPVEPSRDATPFPAAADPRDEGAPGRAVDDEGEVSAVFIPAADVGAGDTSRQASAIWDGLRAVLAGERREFQLEYPIPGLEEPRWFLMRVTRLEEGEGTGTRVVVTNEDITARVRAARAIRRSEGHLRALLESMEDLVFALGLDARCLGVYGRWIGRVGLAADAFPGKRLGEVLGEEAAAPHEAALRTVLNGGHALYRWTLPLDEGARHVEVSLSPIRTATGEIEGAVGVGRDITERVAREEETRRRDAILGAVGFASELFLRDPNWEASIDDVLARLGVVSGVDRVYLVEYDERAERGVGLPRHAWNAPGIPPAETLPPLEALVATGEKPAWLRHLTRGNVVNGVVSQIGGAMGAVLEQRGTRSVALVPILFGGSYAGYLALECCATDRVWSKPELDALRTAADTIGAAMDRKRIEDALLASREQLQQAQKMEAVGQLAGGIAHDFNNLLTAISGRVELLLNDAPHDARRLEEDLQEIRKAADRAATLTRQLLAFSRRQVHQPIPLDLNNVVRDIELLLRRLLGEDMHLVTRLAPRLGTVEADPNHIGQVLMNLAVNARDAMQGGGVLRIETANLQVDTPLAATGETVPPGAYVLLRVTDDGCGMPPEILDRIFEPFFTTKEPGQGTGLGLAMVYGIVKQSNGYIHVESVVGEGTEFTILLPRRSLDPVPLPTPTRGAPAQRPARTATETILLVEDEAAVRTLVRRVLEREGYTVLEATNGAEAIQLSESFEGTIDLLLTDIVMPDLGGHEIAGRLRRSRPDILVLLMSGYTPQEILRRGTVEFNASFIAKPFTPDELVRKVREVLG